MKWRGVIVAGLVVLGGIGYWGYQHALRPTPVPAPGPKEKPAPGDSVFPDRFFDFSSVLNMPKSGGTARFNGQTAPSGGEFKTSGDGAGNGTGNKPGSTSTETPPSAAASAPLKISEAAIKAKYAPAFEQLKREANSRLDQIVAKGLDEYRQNQATGNMSVQALVAKYSGPAKKLEASINDTFYQLLAQMERDLQQAGLPLDSARLVEAEYKASLQQKKAELIGKMIKR